MELLKTLRWSFLITVVGLAAAFAYDGTTGLAVTAILIVLEVSLSFDNAVVNAKVLTRMSDFWVKIFLTVGVLIAVFGMRLLFPLVVVFVTADLSPVDAWHLALQKGDPGTPGTYGYILQQAHPLIAAFGGVFLLMIFLDFVFDDEKEHHWIAPVERTLAKASRFPGISVLIGLVVLFVFATIYPDHQQDVLVAGVAGLILYLAVGGLGDFFDEGFDEDDESDDPVPVRRDAAGAVIKATGRAALSLFLYLELLDASFSFDGVIGAFAITADPIIIALGLGVGAFYVRSITIYLVNAGTLAEYVFLEHGAHWAIAALAFLLLFSVEHEVPEVVTGLIGVGFIALAVVSSVRYNRRHADEEHVVHV